MPACAAYADTHHQLRDPLVSQSGVFKSQKFFLKQRAEKYAHAVPAAFHVVDGPDAAKRFNRLLVDHHHIAFFVAASTFGETFGFVSSSAQRTAVCVYCHEVTVPFEKPRRCIVAIANNGKSCYTLSLCSRKCSTSIFVALECSFDSLSSTALQLIMAQVRGGNVSRACA
jgi:hypothetical protein